MTVVISTEICYLKMFDLTLNCVLFKTRRQCQNKQTSVTSPHISAIMTGLLSLISTTQISNLLRLDNLLCVLTGKKSINPRDFDS